MSIYNPIIQQNATWSIKGCVRDQYLAYLNLSGWTGESVIKTSISNSTIITTPTVTVTDPLNGGITVSLTAAQTALLTPNASFINIDDEHRQHGSHRFKHHHEDRDQLFDNLNPLLPVWSVLLSNVGQSIILQVLEGRVIVLAGVTVWT